MNHHKSNRKFGRGYAQRRALMRSLARSLVLHEKIQTTEAKAKELRPYIEKLVTLGQGGAVARRRLINSRIGSPEATKKIVDELSKKYESRNGGYTRIIKLAPRKSDGAKMAIIEFV